MLLNIPVELIISGKKSDKVFIVGINGYDASGKTYFAKKLKKLFVSYGYPTYLIHIDDFHNPLKKRREGPNENQAYIDNTFNYSVLLDNIVEPLHQGENINCELELLNLETDRFDIKKDFKLNRE